MPLLVPFSPPTFSVDVDAANARMILRLDWPGVTSPTIYRVDVDGRATPVRNAEPASLVTGPWFGYDYEAPFDVAVYYRAASGSDLTVSGTVVLPSVGRDAWLKHPGQPVLNVIVTPKDLSELARPVVQAVIEVIGRENPVVLSQRRGGPQGTLELWTYTLAERDAMRAILADGSPLLFAPRSGYGADYAWMAFGQASERRPDNAAGDDELRAWVLPFVTVDRPVGLSGAVWSWDAVMATYPTWDALMAAVPTWQDLVENTAGNAPVV